MSGGPKYEYLWVDEDRYKQPTQLPAPTYIHLLLDCVEAKVNDEKVFPQSTSIPFPKVGTLSTVQFSVISIIITNPI